MLFSLTGARCRCRIWDIKISSTSLLKNSAKRCALHILSLPSSWIQMTDKNFAMHACTMYLYIMWLPDLNKLLSDPSSYCRWSHMLRTAILTIFNVWNQPRSLNCKIESPAVHHEPPSQKICTLSPPSQSDPATFLHLLSAHLLSSILGSV